MLHTDTKTLTMGYVKETQRQTKRVAKVQSYNNMSKKIHKIVWDNNPNI